MRPIIYAKGHTYVASIPPPPITVVSHKYAPPPLLQPTSAQNARGGGGAFARDATISLAITPSLPVKHDLIVGGGWGQARGGEILSTLAVAVMKF